MLTSCLDSFDPTTKEQSYWLPNQRPPVGEQLAQSTLLG
jgi:hypothetical protein